jgi:hypothetical protein
MPDEQSRLIRRAFRYAAVGDRMTATFARELQRVLKSSERELAKLVIQARAGSKAAAARAQVAILMRSQVRAILLANGYDAVVATATQQAAEALVKVALSTRERAALATFQASGEAAVTALRELMTVDLLQQGDAVATTIWRSLTQNVLGNKPADAVVADLAKALDRSEAQARTLFDTQVSMFTRTVESVATGVLGPDQPYLFSGPVDNSIRPFCRQFVGTVLTRKDIDGLDNGQLPDAFITGGGYNCRHTWLAVESRELRALAGTGKRIGGVAADIARVDRNRRKGAA